MTAERVLVTGGSGFLAAHCLIRVLDDGYAVRTTVRSLDRAAKVRAMVEAGGSARAGEIDVVAADLTSHAGWDAAVEGCDFVLHVASPYPAVSPADEDELIVPARDGALRVLAAARRAGVKRVVLTSSFAAIGYGHAPTSTPYDESIWTDVAAPGVTAYAKSKTLAEQSAWEYVREHPGIELAVVNPTGILGPALDSDLGTSLASIAMIVQGRMPVLPKASVGVVDVRDIAELHVRAMTSPHAAGERFIGTAGVMTLPEMAQALKEGLGPEGVRISTRSIPDWAVRLAAKFDDSARQALPMLGTPHRSTSAKALRLLGWSPRPAADTVVTTGRTILSRLSAAPRLAG